MKLSIIPIDGAVCEDGVCYVHMTWEGTPTDVHALQWQDTSGWIEYNDGKVNEEITALPDWVDNALAAWTVANTPEPITPPTAELNKLQAIWLLQQTDWATIADVCDPQMANPYLANQADFITYRNLVRQYAVYPEEGDIVWPTVPTENWVKV
jgi:hypothetical protein